MRAASELDVDLRVLAERLQDLLDRRVLALGDGLIGELLLRVLELRNLILGALRLGLLDELVVLRLQLFLARLRDVSLLIDVGVDEELPSACSRSASSSRPCSPKALTTSSTDPRPF